MPEYFATRPLIPLPDAKPMNLLDLLRAPAVGSPRSLADQLALIRKLWKPLLGDSLERLLEIAGEILREEELAIWMQFNPPRAGSGAAEGGAAAPERGQQQWPFADGHSRGAGFWRSGATNTKSSRRHRPGCPPRC